MFGCKRRQPRPNPLWDRIYDQIRHELHHNDDEDTVSYEDKYADVPFLPSGCRNNAIAQSLYFRIEPHHRMIWYKIEKEHWTYIKPFLVFLNYLPIDEQVDVPLDPYIVDVLRKI